MIIIHVILMSLLTLSAQAVNNKKGFDILSPAKIRAALGDYPALGTPESDEDFAVLLRYQDTRTEEDCAEARLEEQATLGNMFGPPHGPLTKAELRKLTLRALPVYAEAGANILLAKNLYKRPRPYDANPEVKPCIDLEGSYAYPSGHTALARSFAHMLSAIWPERREEFFRRADKSSENRIIGGVHHPTDIIAGKKLGDVLAKKLMKGQKFKQLVIDLK